ncbi:MAG: YihY/virulence factor BrkB family protein [Methylocystis sp.]|jgi:membrane protein
MRFIARVFYDAYLKFVEDDGWAIASHIALSILTSMFPFLIFVAALAGFFGTPEIADKAAGLLFDAWPARIAGPIAVEIHNVLTQPRGGLLTIGAVLSMYFSANAVEALRIGLDRAYDVQDTRPWWLLRLEAILFVLLAAVSLLAFTFLLVFAPLVWANLQEFAPKLVQELARFYAPVRFGVSSAVLLLVLIVAHKYLPAGHRPLRLIAPGVLMTLVAWLGFGAAFGSYLAEFANNYVSTYAGLASLMIALVFLQWLGALLVFGGQLNQAIARARPR